MAVIWTSSSFIKFAVFSLPLPPAPIIPILTLSLGATNPLPPKTWRGTIINPAAANVDAFINPRLETSRSFLFSSPIYLLIKKEVLILPLESQTSVLMGHNLKHNFKRKNQKDGLGLELNGNIFLNLLQKHQIYLR